MEQNAQKEIDLGLEVSVEPGTIYVGDTAWIHVTLSNEGPEALTTTDTVYYAIGEQIFSIVPEGPIAEGESVTYEDALYYYDASQDTITSDKTLEFCFMLMPQSDIIYNVEGGGTRPAAITYEDANTSNDQSCITIIQKVGDGPSSIFNVSKNFSFDVYPNPVSTDLNFKYSFDKASTAKVNIVDMTGRVLATKDFGKQGMGEQHFSVSVADLPNGNYTLEFVTEGNRGVSKFTVTK
ncbi:MAG: T9SS type A sorting domain-containing protein [Taibaiella sp.]|nr:T9SS type A sorting domain-containing protein [Taibaiella sp.]